MIVDDILHQLERLPGPLRWLAVQAVWAVFALWVATPLFATYQVLGGGWFLVWVGIAAGVVWRHRVLRDRAEERRRRWLDQQGR